MASFLWKTMPVEHLALEGFEGVTAWMSGRRGGVSEPPFATLNLSPWVKDAPAAVTENRRRALLPAGSRRALWARPQHGGRVRAVSRATEDVEPGDGLLTDDPGVVLAQTFADCVPIFVWADDIRWGGILHAGWRGTVANIAAAGVRTLVARGADAKRVQAAIGPSIGPCCYEVREDVAGPIRTLPEGQQFLRAVDEDHFSLDLWGLNQSLLVGAGVSPDHVTLSGLCTGCELSLFFSHRREGPTGRMGGFFCLNDR